MPHKKRPLDRDSGVVRDASLLVIACEDTYIEPFQVQQALRRAREMDTDPNEILPGRPVTRVYRLIQILLERDSIQLGH